MPTALLGGLSGIQGRLSVERQKPLAEMPVTGLELVGMKWQRNIP